MSKKYSYESSYNSYNRPPSSRYETPYYDYPKPQQSSNSYQNYKPGQGYPYSKPSSSQYDNK